MLFKYKVIDKNGGPATTHAETSPKRLGKNSTALFSDHT